MAFTLNSVDLTTYGITAGQAPGGNIALQGCFDLPSRIGDTHHVWDDDNTIEPYVASDEIFFAGRDIILYGAIFGTRAVINDYLRALYSAIDAFSTLVTLSTPYGDFSVQVKSIIPKYSNNACTITMSFREPVVTLTGGTLPAVAEGLYTIDARTFSSFGLYFLKDDTYSQIQGLKEQYFTKYGAEGYQIAKHKNKIFELNCLIMATGLSDFQSKVKALYLLFKSANLRSIKLNNQVAIDCFATEGFKISDVVIMSDKAYARFNASLMCFSVNYVNELSTEAGDLITNESAIQILI
jgi:hypothetical protein